MTRNPIIIITAITLVLASQKIFAADDAHEAGDEGHHLHNNHIALVVAAAYEEKADGHHERGNVIGLEYIRKFSERWGWGAAIEMEAFGDNHDRQGILVLPVSYYANDRWRLLVGPGFEFREAGEREHGVLRIGTSYVFELGERVTLSPEAVIDFVEGGTTVYVLGFSLGYGF